MTEKIFMDLDELFNSFIEILNKYDKSEILQKYFFELFESIFYATLIDNFFINLTPKNLEEYGLSDMDKNIKNKYEDVLEDVNLIMHVQIDQESKKIDAKYYNNFKANLKCDFPKLFNLLLQIEKEIDINRFETYLRDKKDKIKESGRNDTDLNSKIMTTVIAANIKKKNRFPSGKDMDKVNDGLANKLIPDIAHIWFESLKSLGKDMLTEQKEYRSEFELILYEDWKEPLELLECLIRVSLDTVDKHRQKILQKGFREDIKFNALIGIHARALRISNEI